MSEKRQLVVTVLLQLAVICVLGFALSYQMDKNQRQFQQLNQPDAHDGWDCRYV